ncbi:hypothetical protein H0H81_012362 [Sphagnurus paluster]|uniref:Uncharacterized protein n=1 Tax=Sphagnurus paluster TaxID=117069 RepID=A0A9P7GS34_9AGAR|nr:hypothetical protein H0H81_012362 [Sphagnurus paluster]
MASHIRSIVYTPAWEDLQEMVGPLLAHTTSLISLHGEFEWRTFNGWRTVPMNMSTFRSLAIATGRTLQTLSLELVPQESDALPRSPEPLFTFSALRDLVWKTVEVMGFISDVDVPEDALPALEKLTYCAPDDSVLILLQRIALPKLHTVYFPLPQPGAISFLSRHGVKVTTLKAEDRLGLFGLCPNLSLAMISGFPSFERRHEMITKMILTEE